MKPQTKQAQPQTNRRFRRGFRVKGLGLRDLQIFGIPFLELTRGQDPGSYINSTSQTLKNSKLCLEQGPVNLGQVEA